MNKEQESLVTNLLRSFLHFIGLQIHLAVIDVAERKYKVPEHIRDYADDEFKRINKEVFSGSGAYRQITHDDFVDGNLSKDKRHLWKEEQCKAKWLLGVASGVSLHSAVEPRQISDFDQWFKLGCSDRMLIRLSRVSPIIVIENFWKINWESFRGSISSTKA